MSQLRTKPCQFLLDERRDQKIDAIARKMSHDLGMKVSRSAVIARLVDEFFLPDLSLESHKDSEETIAAA